MGNFLTNWYLEDVLYSDSYAKGLFIWLKQKDSSSPLIWYILHTTSSWGSKGKLLYSFYLVGFPSLFISVLSISSITLRSCIRRTIFPAIIWWLFILLRVGLLSWIVSSFGTDWPVGVWGKAVRKSGFEMFHYNSFHLNCISCHCTGFFLDKLHILAMKSFNYLTRQKLHMFAGELAWQALAPGQCHILQMLYMLLLLGLSKSPLNKEKERTTKQSFDSEQAVCVTTFSVLIIIITSLILEVYVRNIVQ